MTRAIVTARFADVVATAHRFGDVANFHEQLHQGSQAKAANPSSFR